VSRPREPNPRNKLIKLYCTQQQSFTIQKKARSAHSTVSLFALKAVLNKPIETIPTINATLYADLARVGSNLNQITRHLNQDWEIGRLPDRDYEALALLVKQTKQALTHTRQSLIGCAP
jgi:hypothetical protein